MVCLHIFAYIFEKEAQIVRKPKNKKAGIDVGVKYFLADLM